MKKTLFLLLLAASVSAQAQSDKWVFSAGYMTELFADLKPNSQLLMRDYRAVALSGYYTALQKNDIVSAGVMTGLTFSFAPQRTVAAGLTTDLLLQVPAYAMVRAGAMSTPYNEQRIGIGLGIGGTFTHSSYVNNYQGAVSLYRLQHLDPQAIGELVVRMGGGTVIFRAHITPLALSGNYRIKQVTNDPVTIVQVPANITNLGFGIAYGF